MLLLKKEWVVHFISQLGYNHNMVKKILIIDDDKIFSKVLKDAFTSTGNDDYEIVVAHDGEEGFEKAKDEKPDLIILDLMMPKVGGIDFLKKMKMQEGVQNTPVIISSQISDIEKISEGMELGIKGYIVKADYSLESIIKQVKDILDDK